MLSTSHTGEPRDMENLPRKLISCQGSRGAGILLIPVWISEDICLLVWFLIQSGLQRRWPHGLQATHIDVMTTPAYPATLFSNISRYQRNQPYYHLGTARGSSGELGIVYFSGDHDSRWIAWYCRIACRTRDRTTWQLTCQKAHSQMSVGYVFDTSNP
ncbi:hypothetical protein BDW67DRAFT_161485 [Aspergillus spinulosporus]